MSRYSRGGTVGDEVRAWRDAQQMPLFAVSKVGLADTAFSTWHYQQHDDDGMADVDWMEACRECGTVVALMETCRDTGTPKSCTWLLDLARRSAAPMFEVHYTPSETRCLPDRRCVLADCDHGISQFRIVRRWPRPSAWTRFDGAGMAAMVRRIHVVHGLICHDGLEVAS